MMCVRHTSVTAPAWVSPTRYFNHPDIVNLRIIPETLNSHKANFSPPALLLHTPGAEIW